MTIARDEELSLLFLEARTHSQWLPRPVDDAILVRLYELARMGPTGGNSHPMRAVFVKSAAAKERLLPSVFPLNVEKVRSAPVTAILAWDAAFYERLPQLFPARPELREAVASRPAAVRERQAEQSATLTAGYLVLAARALGLDCGPMGGFDAAATDAAFFPDGNLRTFLLLNLGYGDAGALHPRNPRLAFDEACRID